MAEYKHDTLEIGVRFPTNHQFMLANEGYYEMQLWNNHSLQVWTAGRLCILRHPLGCDIESDACRERLIKYMHNEGILDEVLDKPIIMIDSYAKESEE